MNEDEFTNLVKKCQKAFWDVLNEKYNIESGEEKLISNDKWDFFISSKRAVKDFMHINKIHNENKQNTSKGNTLR